MLGSNSRDLTITAEGLVTINGNAQGGFNRFISITAGDFDIDTTGAGRLNSQGNATTRNLILKPFAPSAVNLGTAAGGFHLSDDELVRKVCEDLGELMEIPEEPVFSQVLRPTSEIPQLEMDHPAHPLPLRLRP